MMSKDMHVFANPQDFQGRMVQKAIKELVFLGSKAPQDLQVRFSCADSVHTNNFFKVYFRKNVDVIWKKPTWFVHTLLTKYILG